MNWCHGETETNMRISFAGCYERVKLGTLNLLTASSQTHLSIASQINAILSPKRHTYYDTGNQQALTYC